MNQRFPHEWGEWACLHCGAHWMGARTGECWVQLRRELERVQVDLQRLQEELAVGRGRLPLDGTMG